MAVAPQARPACIVAPGVARQDEYLHRRVYRQSFAVAAVVSYEHSRRDKQKHASGIVVREEQCIRDPDQTVRSDDPLERRV
ncbi:hypothetical protein JCM8202v2_002421 [Rhodotorula sphaerocarpa]